MFQTTRFRNVEVVLNNSALQNFNFDPDATLQGAARIVGIQAYSITDVPKSPTSGKALVADTVLAKSFLTIVSSDGDQEVISMRSLIDLNPRVNNGRLQLFNIEIPNITKCYIRVADASGLTQGTVWLLGFHYVSKADLKKVAQPVKL